jgi:hypothetical protein
MKKRTNPKIMALSPMAQDCYMYAIPICKSCYGEQLRIQGQQMRYTISYDSAGRFVMEYLLSFLRVNITDLCHMMPL